MISRLAYLSLLLSTIVVLTDAIPAFVPVKSERSPYGLAQRRQSKTPKNLARAQQKFDEQLASTIASVASKYPVDYLSNVSDYSMWEEFQDTGKLPEPINGKTGATSIGPENVPLDRQNPDTYAPPNTDSGTVPQGKWPFSLSHNRLQNGGWARQQNVDVLPVATAMAGVNMRLEEGAYREMHWHSTSEWAYILNGTFRVALVNSAGQNDISDLGPGDLWFFESGLPHSIQSTSKGGGEFLLVFDDGSFSEDNTLLLSDFISHVPREVLVKNFPGFVNADFDKAPNSELYIFPGTAPAANDSQQVASPQGKTNSSVTYKFSEQEATQLNGGSVKIVDSSNFPASTAICAAEVTIEPGAMRELHWHPLSDEWDYFISGHARITVFAGNTNARTYDFQAGDVGYLTKSNGHYIENIGTTPVKYLEVFTGPKYSDVSLSNWLALTPPAVVKQHLGFTDATIDKLDRFKTKNYTLVPDNHAQGNQKRDLASHLVAGKRSWA
ncbi:hypothetical protein CBS101457_003202 [Exobasidium rhododendri]|nr:hypothetical protein CBS101457_003202 [Exobasidium rhododendri]